MATGLFNAGFNPAELNSRSLSETILKRHPNGTAPLFAISGQAGKKEAIATEHGYFTKVFRFNQITVTAAALAAATNFVTASTAELVVGQLYMVPSSREIVRVTAIVDATNFTVARGYGRILAAPVLANENLVGAGSAYPEGAPRPTARNLATQYIRNFTQIFRNSWAVTGTAASTAVTAGEGNVATNRGEMLMFHAADIETALLFGQASQVTPVNGQPERTTQGIFDAIAEYAPVNVKLAGATTSLTQLEIMLESAFSTTTNMGNSKSRIAFVDGQSLRVINQIARANGVVELMPDETSFGMAFSRFRFFKGELLILEHPMMSDNPALAGTMLVLDIDAVKLAYLSGRDSLLEEYGADGKSADNGVDAVGGSILSELAVEFVNPQACAYISGLTQGVAG